MSGADHSGFIVAAYLVAATVVAGMIAAIVLDGRRLRRALARLERDRDARP